VLNLLVVFGLTGFAVGILTVAVFFGVMLLLPAKPCGGCGELLPKIRRNPNRKQALQGISICPKCGSEVDRLGRKVGPGSTTG
jgi:hypothetical protein